ncbi:MULTISPECIES: hypothetical protein [unclassified Tenacibaculum]|uniref:hypothetical protein n=1 Tax=unclassified Tenacibaculum TaxID=2635139 RepID=UPI001F289310|nr:MULTISPECIES: hypothetical protein [unclassified Tenacibaculum]MCF2874198.1 hypothetical protein [Tenacibaculum sp. Cn5-1]MCF2934779.1 hypothetical protein [Tenacibaculum sp. Cn5-34]MCG7510989.1 hypothetical protein [Tenacibaculum sp. Cn5-46]
MKKILIVLLLGITAVGMSQEKVLLRLNYKKGDTYKMSMKMNQDMGAALMDMDMDMNIKVTDVKEGDYVTETKFTYMSTKVLQGAEEKVNFNTNMKEGELTEESKKFKAQMQPMMDAMIYSSVSKLGKSKFLKAEPTFPGADQLSNQYNQSVEYPEEKVGVGSTWTNTQNSGGVAMELMYTVTEITKEKVIAKIKGKMSAMPTAKITGTIEIMKSTGIPSKSVVSIEMDMMGQMMKTKAESTIEKI